MAEMSDVFSRVPQTYRVLYPSGTKFTAKGILVFMSLGGELGRREALDTISVVNLNGDPSRMASLDPRAVIWDEAGVIVYSPRLSHVTRIAPALFPKMIADWLDEHPEWPSAAIAQQGEVPRRG